MEQPRNSQKTYEPISAQEKLSYMNSLCKDESYQMSPVDFYYKVQLALEYYHGEYEDRREENENNTILLQQSGDMYSIVHKNGVTKTLMSFSKWQLPSEEVISDLEAVIRKCVPDIQ